MEDTKGELLGNEFKAVFNKKFIFCPLVESYSSGKSPEGCSREPLVQLQSLQAQEKQVVSLPKVHGFKELSWPPRVAVGGQSTSLKQFPQHQLPLSHSQDPVIITAGRPIVILPNDYIHSHRNFIPGASLSTAFNLQSPIQSLGDFCDHTPAPMITPVNDDLYAGPIPTPAIMHVDDDGPSVECTVPPKHFGGVRAIEFTDNKQGIVSGQPGISSHCKEESTLTTCTSKQASLDVSCVDVDASQPEAELNVIPKSPSIIDLSVTSLPKVDLMLDDESANIKIPSQYLNPPLLGVESGSNGGSSLGLQLPAQKSSSVRVSPLIMSCYEESKEQLVLDDSDSELEMPECSKSGSCTPQQSIEQDTSKSMTGTDVQAHDAKLPPIREESVDDVDEKSDSCEPPPKRAKMVETSSTDSNSPTADECNHTPVGSDVSQNLDTHSPIADEASSTEIAESSESFGQTVPNESFLFADCAPLETAESTKTSSVLATTIPDCTFKLECPHEPVDLASDGNDTIDQMLPTESARQHAMVPNLVRCADDNQLTDDRDRPSDDGNDSIHLKAYIPAVDLHSSHQESLEGIQERVGDDSLVPGQTVVKEKMEADIQVPELHDDKPCQHGPYNYANIDYSANHQTDVHGHSMVVPSTEHQIVPDEFGNSTTPSSSQSLYTDHDFHEKCKPRLQLQNESSVDDELDSPQVLAVSLDSIEKRWSVATTLPHSDDQALPDLDLESPSKLPTQHCGSLAGVGDSCGHDSNEQGDTSAQNFAPFGFRVGKCTTYSQSKCF